MSLGCEITKRIWNFSKSVIYKALLNWVDIDLIHLILGRILPKLKAEIVTSSFKLAFNYNVRAAKYSFPPLIQFGQK